MRHGVVYMATSPSGKRYIGKTVQPLAQRISKHKREPRCRAFYAALMKYGDQIQWCVIATVKEECLNKFERFYIAELKPEYNMTDGGEGGIPNAAVRANMSAAHTGKKHTPERRANISAGLKGKPKTPEHRANLRKPKSEAHKRKLRVAAKQQWAETPPERIAERNAKVSAGNKAANARKRQRKTGLLV